MANKLTYVGFIASATGLSMSGAYKVIDLILAGSTIAGIVAAVVTGGGVAIGSVLIKKVLQGASKNVAKTVMAGW